MDLSRPGGTLRNWLADRPQAGCDRNGVRVLWIGFAILCMAISGALLFLAQGVIPMEQPMLSGQESVRWAALR